MHASGCRFRCAGSIARGSRLPARCASTTPGSSCFGSSGALLLPLLRAGYGGPRVEGFPFPHTAQLSARDLMHLSLTDSCLPRSRIVETISYGCISRSNKSAIAASASGFDTFLLDAISRPSSPLRVVDIVHTPRSSNIKWHRALSPASSFPTGVGTVVKAFPAARGLPGPLVR